MFFNNKKGQWVKAYYRGISVGPPTIFEYFGIVLIATLLSLLVGLIIALILGLVGFSEKTSLITGLIIGILIFSPIIVSALSKVLGWSFEETYFCDVKLLSILERCLKIFILLYIYIPIITLAWGFSFLIIISVLGFSLENIDIFNWFITFRAGIPLLLSIPFIALLIEYKGELIVKKRETN